MPSVGPLGLALCVLFSACERPHARGGQAAARVNLALGKPYTLTPAPSYALCTDPDDLRQLTDGRTAGAEWRKKSTVGWRYAEAPPVAVIDLGRVEPIEEVRVHTVGGGHAGVFYPATVLVMVSDDQRTFHAVGAAHNTGLAQSRFNRAAAPKTPHVFRIGPLKTRGRFVLVSLEVDGAHLFVDEIEVIRGEHDPDAVSFAPQNRFQRAEARKLLAVLRERAELVTLLKSLSARAQDRFSGEAKARLRALERRIAAPQAVYDVGEIRRLLKGLYTLRGRALRRRHNTRLAWIVANPMEQLRSTATLPGAGQRAERIELRCWQGEYESAAVTLLNCGESALRLRVSVSPLQHRNGSTYPAENCVTLRQSVVVHSRSLGPIHDALVKLGDQGLTLPGGRVGQLWLTLHNPALPPGDYDFVVHVAAADEADLSVRLPELAIPGRLTVDPLLFPDRPSLKTCTWSYIQRGTFTSRAPREARADLKAHHVNVFVLTAQEIPLPKLGGDGRIRVDFDRHAAALRLYDDAERYLFFWARTEDRPDLPDLPSRLSPAWKGLMKGWLRQWVAFLHQHGIGYDRFAMYPFDEYIGDEFYKLARFIKEEVDPRIRVFANSRGDKRGRQMKRIAPYIDIWCLPDQVAGFRHPGRERALRANASLWTYAARGPSKANSPYGYYRLQMWRAFSRGDRGCGFWTYAQLDQRVGTTWDDRSSGAGPYDVVYGQRGCPIDTAGEAIIPSRRWEAWREGVEDYEYLARLKIAIQSAQHAGRTAAAKQAQRVLERAVQDVLNAPDRADVVYNARRALVAQILELERS